MTHSVVCKRIIDGQTYDTSTSRLIARFEDDDGPPIEEFLFKTPGGAYFLYALDEYAPKEYVKPLNENEARAWIERCCPVQVFEVEFGPAPAAIATLDPNAVRISEITRRDIFDRLRLNNVDWSGRLSESAFLSRLYDLKALPTTDRRCATMYDDVVQHRENWDDWNGRDWVYDDARLNLLRCPDAEFLRFLCETVHPIVRVDELEAQALAADFNVLLARDGYEIAVKARLSGRSIYAGVRRIQADAVVRDARRVAATLQSDYVMAQITRMETSVLADPGLAIGSAKEFVETICKGILRERAVSLTGNEDLPKLFKLTREALDLAADARTEETLRRTTMALATLVQGIAELRGQLGTGHGADPAAGAPAHEVAAFAVRTATALGVFLYEMHVKTSATPGAA